MWESLTANSLISLDCYLPTGVLINLKQVQIECVLSEIKTRVWEEARCYPLFSLLQEKSSYAFVCVNRKGKQEELLDESQSLVEIKPYKPLLKLIQRKGDREEKLFSSSMSALIGKNLCDFDEMEDSEVCNFRRKYRAFAEKISKKRMELDWKGRAMYAFPPELESESVPLHVENKLMESRRFLVSVVRKDIKNARGESRSYSVSADTFPSELVGLDLRKCARLSGLQTEYEQAEDFVLKIVGRESFLLGEHPLLSYKVRILLNTSI